MGGVNLSASDVVCHHYLIVLSDSAVCHYYLTVHPSGPNTGDSVRRGFVLNYTGEGAEVDGVLRAAHAEAVAKQRGVGGWKLVGHRYLI